MIWLIKFKTDRQTNKKFTDRETRSRNLKRMKKTFKEKRHTNGKKVKKTLNVHQRDKAKNETDRQTD